MNSPEQKTPTKALVILSGGQDSTTCAFWAKQTFDEVHCLTFDYGQRHAREIQAAHDIAKIIGAASHTVLEVGPILKGRSPLTNKDETLETYSDFESMDQIIGDRVEKTFVPMRNALFLTLAANHAICLDILNLVTGVCQADNANYPDCRQSFITYQERTINEALGLTGSSSKDRVQVWTPLMDLSKKETAIFATGLSPSLPISQAFTALAFTHTAYDGHYPPVGSDHASVLRAHGFQQAGLPDPLVLRAWSEGLMELPVTSNYGDDVLCTKICAAIKQMKATYGLREVGEPLHSPA